MSSILQWFQKLISLKINQNMVYLIEKKKFIINHKYLSKKKITDLISKKVKNLIKIMILRKGICNLDNKKYKNINLLTSPSAFNHSLYRYHKTTQLYNLKWKKNLIQIITFLLHILNRHFNIRSRWKKRRTSGEF